MAARFIMTAMLALVMAWVCVSFFSSDFGTMMADNAVRRQMDHVCAKLHDGAFSREQLCTVLPPQIPALEPYYRRIQESDGKWYADHKSLYYPNVQCSADKMHMRLLGQTYSCEAGRSVRIDEKERVLAGD